MGSEKVRDLPLALLTLPEDLSPFAPYRDRLTLVMGLRGAQRRGEA